MPIARRATPLETARAYLATEPTANVAAPRLLALVATVDRAAYHADEPDVAESDEAWQYHDERGARPARRPVPATAGPDAARSATAVPPRRVAQASDPPSRGDHPPSDEAETDDDRSAPAEPAGRHRRRSTPIDE